MIGFILGIVAAVFLIWVCKVEIILSETQCVTKENCTWDFTLSRHPAEKEEITSDDERITKAIDIALGYGTTDGGFHKMWVIDQMIRTLAGKNYEKVIEDFESETDENGDQAYEWCKGVAP